MARSREFDRHTALSNAMTVFWEKGYAGASTSDLLGAMGIGRQSMYDTFGDKYALYLEALRHYSESSVSELLHTLQGETPLAAIANMLQAYARRPEEQNALGCMGVNAVCEFGQRDAGVNATREWNNRLLNDALEQLLRDAQAAGEVPPALDVAAGAAFLAATLAGMKVGAKAGADARQLASIAAFAVKGLV